MSVTEEQVHLSVVHAVCPESHRTGTQKAGGSKLRCCRCWQEHGREVLVTVPLRDGEAPRPRRDQAKREPRADQCECRTCGATGQRADAGTPPIGWVTVLVAADPARTRDGKPRRVLGPYCSTPCAAAGLAAVGPRSGVRELTVAQIAGLSRRAAPARSPETDIRNLMTQIPRGARP